MISKHLKENGSVILSSFAGIGVIGTAYLASKATYQVARDIEPTHRNDKKTLVKRYWKLYIPAGISATSTIICIAAANRVESRKVIAAQSALAVTQRVYSEYREHVVDELGEKKEQVIRDKMAEKQVHASPPSAKDGLLIMGQGNVLCCELHTGRYFGSDMMLLKKAENEVNSKILKHDVATLDDLYYIIGLNPITESSHQGWTSEKLLELEFHPILTEDERPCLAFRYNYLSVV